MKKLLILAALLICPQLAHAQSQRNPCYNTTTSPTTNCVSVGIATPLPVINEGGSNLATAQVSVGVTATLVAAARPSRVAVSVTNAGAVDVFCGGPTVTITTGDLLTGTKGSTKAYQTNTALYCIVGSGTQIVTVAESY
jgi:hypothetical protein